MNREHLLRRLLQGHFQNVPFEAFCDLVQGLAFAKVGPAAVIRKVDLVTRGSLRNPFRRHENLRTRQVVYAA